MPEDKLRKVYDAIIERGVPADDLGDYPTFVNNVVDTNLSKKLYSNLISQELFTPEELGGEFNEFYTKVRENLPKDIKLSPQPEIPVKKLEDDKDGDGWSDTGTLKQDPEGDFGAAISGYTHKGLNMLGSELARGPQTLARFLVAPQNWLADQTGQDWLRGDAETLVKVFDPLGVNKPFADFYDKRIEINQKKIEENNPQYQKGILEAAQEGDWATAGKNLLGGLLESTPSSLAMMMSAPLGPGAMTGFGTVMFGGEKMKELDQQAPDMPEWKKSFIGAASGAMEGLFETALGAGAFSRAMKDIVTTAGKDVAKKEIKTKVMDRFSKMIAENPYLAVFGQGFEEVGTQYAQNAIDKYSGYKPDLKLNEGVADVFIMGTAMGGVYSGVGYGAKGAVSTSERLKKRKQLLGGVDKPLRSQVQQIASKAEPENALDRTAEFLKQYPELGYQQKSNILRYVTSEVMSRSTGEQSEKAQMQAAAIQGMNDFEEMVRQVGHSDGQRIVVAVDKTGNRWFITDGDVVTDTETGKWKVGMSPVSGVNEQGEKKMLSPKDIKEVGVQMIDEQRQALMDMYNAQLQSAQMQAEQQQQVKDAELEVADAATPDYTEGDKINYKGEVLEVTDASDLTQGIEAARVDDEGGRVPVFITPQEYDQAPVLSEEELQQGPQQEQKAKTPDKATLEYGEGRSKKQLGFIRSDEGVYTSEGVYEKEKAATKDMKELDEVYPNLEFEVRNDIDPEDPFARNAFTIVAKPKNLKEDEPGTTEQPRPRGERERTDNDIPEEGDTERVSEVQAGVEDAAGDEETDLDVRGTDVAGQPGRAEEAEDVRELEEEIEGKKQPVQSTEQKEGETAQPTEQEGGQNIEGETENKPTNETINVKKNAVQAYLDEIKRNGKMEVLLSKDELIRDAKKYFDVDLYTEEGSDFVYLEKPKGEPKVEKPETPKAEPKPVEPEKGPIKKEWALELMKEQYGLDENNPLTQEYLRRINNYNESFKNAKGDVPVITEKDVMKDMEDTFQLKKFVENKDVLEKMIDELLAVPEIREGKVDYTESREWGKIWEKYWKGKSSVPFEKEVGRAFRMLLADRIKPKKGGIEDAEKVGEGITGKTKEDGFNEAPKKETIQPDKKKEGEAQVKQQPKEEKQPWEMTRGEFGKTDYKDNIKTTKELFGDEEYIVRVGYGSNFGGDLFYATLPGKHKFSDILDDEYITSVADKNKPKGYPIPNIQRKSLFTDNNEYVFTDLTAVPVPLMKTTVHETDSKIDRPAFNLTDDAYDDLILKAHKKIIQQALSEGKKVPEEVLKDYPELTKTDKTKTDKTKKGKEDEQQLPDTGTEKPSDKNAPADTGERKTDKGTEKAGGKVKRKPQVKTDVKTAIQEVIGGEVQKYKGQDITTKQAETFYSYFKDGNELGLVKSKDNEDIEGLEYVFVEYNEDADTYTATTKEIKDKAELYPYVITPFGKELINAINARVQTRKGVSEGTDLFPETANIPEFIGDVLQGGNEKLKSNEKQKTKNRVQPAKDTKRSESGKTYRRGEKVETTYGTYYVNGVNKELDALWKKGMEQGDREYKFAEKGVKIVNSKYFTEDNDVAAQARSWFDDKQQPTERQVSRAMIWSYDQFGDYQIKKGGGSDSDNVFVSSFTTTIADPKTGNDKDVVVIKKYGTSLKDVLITIDEIQELQDLTESPKVREVRKKDQLSGAISLLISNERGKPTARDNKTGEKVKAPKKWIDQLVKQLKDEYSSEEISERLNRFERNYIEDSQIPIEGDNQESSKIRTKHYKEYLNALNTVREKLLDTPDNTLKAQIEEGPPPMRQLSRASLNVLQSPELKKFEGRMVNPITIQQQLNRPGVKNIEKIIINDVLSMPEFKGKKKIPYDDFKIAVEANLMPLEKIYSTSYGEYGMDNMGGNEDYGNGSTIIFNAPIEHGKTGHFPGDFITSNLSFTHYEPRQVPGTDKWVAMDVNRPDVSPEEMSNYVGTVGTKESVERWIKNYNQRKDNGDRETNIGMFGHARVWDGNKFYIAELQSDYYQKQKAFDWALQELFSTPERITDKAVNLALEAFNKEIQYRQDILDGLTDKYGVDENNAEKIISGIGYSRSEPKYEAAKRYSDVLSDVQYLQREVDSYKSSPKKLATVAMMYNYGALSLNVPVQAKKELKALRAEIEKSFTSYEKQFIASQKEDIHLKRMLLEIIKEAAVLGKSEVRIPTERTAAAIEGFINTEVGGLPYEVIQSSSPTGLDLDVGDIIDYAGTEMVVIDATAVDITVAQYQGDTKEWDVNEYIEDETRFEMENIDDDIEASVGDVNAITADELRGLSLSYSVENNLPDPEQLEDGETVDYYEFRDAIEEVILDEVGNARGYANFKELLEGEFGYALVVEAGDKLLVWEKEPYAEVLKQPNQYSDAGETDAEFDISDLSDNERTVVKKYTKLAKIFNQVRGDENVEKVTDDNGFTWYETPITKKDFDDPIIVFQAENTAPMGGFPLFQSLENPFFRKYETIGELLKTDKVAQTEFETKLREKVAEFQNTLGVPIVVLNTMNDLPEGLKRQVKDEMKKSPGFYDTRGQKAYIILNNTRSLESATRTILHEVVAHHGLRQLLGARFDNVLDQVWKSMGVEARQLMEARYRTNTDTRLLAEEYLAMKSERASKPTFIQKAIAKLRDILRRMFGSYMRWTNNDINVLLNMSRRNLEERASAKKGANFIGEMFEARVMSQDDFYKTDFYKEEVSEYKKFAKDLDAKNKDLIITSSEANTTNSFYIKVLNKDYKPILTFRVSDHSENFTHASLDQTDRWNLSFGNTELNKSIISDAIKKHKAEQKAIRKAVDTYKKSVKKGDEVTINDKQYIVESVGDKQTRLKEKNPTTVILDGLGGDFAFIQKQGYTSVYNRNRKALTPPKRSVSGKEWKPGKLDDGVRVLDEGMRDGVKQYRFGYTYTQESSYSNEYLAKELGYYTPVPDMRFTTAQTDTPEFKKWFGDSKVVDENGEPLVVYHGTGGDFSEFTHNYWGGYYFTNTQEVAEHFAKYKNFGSPPSIIPAYLSIQKPYVFDLKGKDIGKPKDYIEVVEAENNLYNKGYDGIILKNVKDGIIPSYPIPNSDVYVTFSPTQIKSATANVGTFDPNNPDIRYQTGDALTEEAAGEGLRFQAPEGEMPEFIGEFLKNPSTLGKLKDPLSVTERPEFKVRKNPMVEGRWETFREYAQDKMLSVRRLQEEVLKRGGTVNEFSNPYREENLSQSASRAQMTYFDKEQWQPLMEAVADIIKETSFTAEDINRYLLAKHAPERNKYMAEKKEQEYDPETTNYSGFTTNEAEYYIDQFERAVPEEMVERLHNTVRDATNFTLERWYQDGFISKEEYDDLARRYDYYVPLRGWSGEKPSDVFDYTKDDIKGSFNPNKAAKGRSSIPDDPLPHIITMAYTSIISGNKNRAKQQMLNLVLQNKQMDDLFQLKRVYLVQDENGEWNETVERPSQEMFDEGRAKIKYNRGHEIRNTIYNAKEHEVTVYKFGEKYVIVFPGDPNIARAMNNENMVDVPKVLEYTLGNATRYLSMVYTSKNPAFIPVNWLRDITFATMSHAIRSDGDVKGFIKNVPSASKAIHRHLSGKADESPTKLDNEYREFMELGGETGYVHLDDFEKFRKQILRDTRILTGQKQVKDHITHNRIVRTAGKWIDYMAIMSENMARFATYRASLQQGKTKKQAAQDAKDVTVNFNRKGRIGALLGSLWAFYNANIQGGHTFAKLAKHHGKKFAAFTLSWGVLGFIVSELARLLSPEDDEGNKYYDMLSEFTRENYMILPNPLWFIEGNENTKNKFLKIPLPHGFRAVYSMGAVASEAMHKLITTEDAVWNTLDNTVSAFSPLSFDVANLKEGKFPARTFIPTGAQPVTDIWMNENFMGSPVYKESFTRDLEEWVPDSEKGMPYVNPFIANATKKLNKLAGGDEVRSAKYYIDPKTGEIKESGYRGALDINPSKIEHLLEGYTGGTGKFFNNVVKTATDVARKISGDPEAEIHTYSLPIARRFVASAHQGNYWRDFFEIGNKVKTYEYFKRAYKKDGDVQMFRALEENVRMQSITSLYNSYYKNQIKPLRDAVKDLPEDVDPEPYYEAMDRAIQSFLQDYKYLNEQFEKNDNNE